MQRTCRIGFRTGFICCVLSLFVTLGMGVRAVPELLTGGLTNPDSYMRLVRLRDMLDGGQILFGVSRDGSGEGALLHWSHLIDALLLVLAWPLGLVLNAHDSLHVAALLFGPLTMAALGLAVAWTAAPFAGGNRLFLCLGALLPALSPAIVSYGTAGVVHHHVPIVLVAVLAWGMAARLILGLARPATGLWLGFCAGIGVWLTPESVPLTAMAFGALALVWVRSPGRDDIPRAAGLTGLAFALTTGLALCLDPPAAGIAVPEIDRLSILFAALAFAVALTGLGAWGAHALCRPRSTRFLPARFIPARFIPARFIPARFIMAAGIGLASCGLWAMLFRDTLLQPHLGLDAEQWHAFFDPISEMHPIPDLVHALHFILTGVLALLVAGVPAARHRSLLLGYVTLCLAALLLEGAAHVRFSAYPEAAGAIALPVALASVVAATAGWHPVWQSFTRLAIITLFLQVPYLGQLAAFSAAAQAAPDGADAASTGGTCSVAGAAAMLDAHPGAVVLTDVNDTPELLYRTRIRTVGSLYHRNTKAFLRMRAAWRAAPSAAVPPEIDAAAVSLVLGCLTGARTPMVSDLARVTLFDQVRTGTPPSWLRRVDENPASGYVLYEVAR